MASYITTSESFIAYCRNERRMSPHTVQAYRLDLNRFGEFLASNCARVAVEQITKEHLRAYQQSLGHLKPRSVGRRMAALRSLFIYAEAEKLIETSVGSENLIADRIR
jgi:site-specific recombinase XerD